MNGNIQPNLCHGCGRPPRVCEITNVVIPLKKCSRCGQSFYHDAECQRRHCREHKTICQVIAKENMLVKRHIHDQVVSVKGSSNLFQVQKRTDGELGLFAMQDIDASHSMQFCAMAPPILFKEFRRTHCAMCFREVRDPEDAIIGNDDPRYTVLLCSDECGSACEDWMRDEIYVIQRALALDSNMVVLPMAIQVYRLLRFADWEEVMSMQSHAIVEDKAILRTVHQLGFGSKQMVDTFLKDNPENGSELLQRQCVLMTVFRMLSFNNDALKSWTLRNSNIYTVNEDLISDFLQRIKYNAFTMTMDDTAPGFAMYKMPSYRINHSCDANARQSFDLRKGQFPKLLVDLVKPVPAGQEICISYVSCDNVSILDRRKDLVKKYRFLCQCPLCMAEAL